MQFGVVPRASSPLAKKIEAQTRPPTPAEIRHRQAMERRHAEGTRHKNLGKIIMREVAKRHGLTVGDLESPSRNKTLVMARHEAMFLVAQECTRLSFPEIGALFGGRDHTTAMHGVRKHGQKIGATSLPRGLPLVKGAEQGRAA